MKVYKEDELSDLSRTKLNNILFDVLFELDKKIRECNGSDYPYGYDREYALTCLKGCGDAISQAMWYEKYTRGFDWKSIKVPAIRYIIIVSKWLNSGEEWEFRDTVMIAYKIRDYMKMLISDANINKEIGSLRKMINLITLAECLEEAIKRLYNAETTIRKDSYIAKTKFIDNLSVTFNKRTDFKISNISYGKKYHFLVEEIKNDNIEKKSK